MTIFDSIILGIIEGFTEFLPISSTGHLIVASEFLGINQTDVTKAYEVIIQFAAIFAVFFTYKDKFSIKKINLWTKVIAAFIPIVMGMGGNIATQSSTIVVRGIATGRINMGDFRKIVFKEMKVGLILGVLYGSFLGILAFFGYAEPKLLGVVVGLSIFFSMAMAATVGTAIPLVLKRFDIDAAVATGPFVTTAIDILGVLAYFMIAKYFLNL